MAFLDIASTHHALIEDDLVWVGSVPRQRASGAEEAWPALGGVPAIPVTITIIIIIIIIILPYMQLARHPVWATG